MTVILMPLMHEWAEIIVSPWAYLHFILDSAVSAVVLSLQAKHIVCLVELDYPRYESSCSSAVSNSIQYGSSRLIFRHISIIQMLNEFELNECLMIF